MRGFLFGLGVLYSIKQHVSIHTHGRGMTGSFYWLIFLLWMAILQNKWVRNKGDEPVYLGLDNLTILSLVDAFLVGS